MYRWIFIMDEKRGTIVPVFFCELVINDFWLSIIIGVSTFVSTKRIIIDIYVRYLLSASKINDRFIRDDNKVD